MKNLIGRTVDITDHESFYCGEWGTIIAQDEDGYHIAIANGTDSVPLFDRNQFRVKKDKHFKEEYKQ